MITVGLTGGIGSGKSTVSRQFASYGAVVVDADLLAREAVAPGSAGLADVVAEFGPDVLMADGSLDRPALGAVVFADAAALARLNAIVHPAVAVRTVELVAQAERDGFEVLVHDVPLLVETGATSRYDEVVVVATSPEVQLDRLVRSRGMSPADAQARIAAQAPLADKLAVATRVLRNDGTPAELEQQVRALWDELTGR